MWRLAFSHVGEPFADWRGEQDFDLERGVSTSQFFARENLVKSCVLNFGSDICSEEVELFFTARTEPVHRWDFSATFVAVVTKLVRGDTTGEANVAVIRLDVLRFAAWVPAENCTAGGRRNRGEDCCRKFGLDWQGEGSGRRIWLRSVSTGLLFLGLITGDPFLKCSVVIQKTSARGQ